MSRVPQIIEAAHILSHRLQQAGVAHAFHGGFLGTLLGSPRDTEELFCIVDRGFLSVRDALAGVETFTTSSSIPSNRFFVTYTEPIPSIEIEILAAGEEGPRQLDQTTTQIIHGVPFLTPTEFLRAKARVWAISAEADDATDIAYVLARYWSRVDINRIPDDMERFVQTYPQSAPAWEALRERYVMK